MAWIDRLREWIRGLLGSAWASSSEDGTGDDPFRLDPDNVTEVRTEADDDPVGRLREVEQQRPANGPEDESGEDDGRPKD